MDVEIEAGDRGRGRIPFAHTAQSHGHRRRRVHGDSAYAPGRGAGVGRGIDGCPLLSGAGASSPPVTGWGTLRHGNIEEVIAIRISTVMALAMVASKIWNKAKRSPLAVGPKIPTTKVTTIVVMRNRGRVAHAASGMIAQSRYQGCTTGKSRTVAPRATPRPPTGCSRPRSTAISSHDTTIAMISTPMARVRDSTAVVWSPKPSRIPTWPVPSASNVGGDIQLRTTFAVPRVYIQPKPRPLAHPITAITAND